MNISELKYKDVYKIAQSVFESDGWRLTKLELLAKRFLEKTLVINVYTIGYVDLRKEYIKSSNDDDCPDNEEDFYIYICNTYLSIRTLPIEMMANFYEDAVKDIHEIDKRLLELCDLQNEINRNKIVNGYLTAEQTYQYYLIEHYKNKNEKARNEIIDFLINKLPSESVNRAKSKSYMVRFPAPPVYSYSGSSLLITNNYDINYFSDIMNKFMDLSFPEYRKLFTKYKKNEINLSDYLRSYINRERVVSQIDMYVLSNHILNNKIDIITYIKTAFIKNDFIAFNNIVPLHIEGIFNDICYTLGSSDKELSSSSLNDKLSIINNKISSFYIYEYFAFSFPIIRNRIAHGNLITDDQEFIANMLVLDLLSVYEFTNDDNLPYLKEKRELNSFLSSDMITKFGLLIENPGILDINIPDFYNENKELCEFKEYIDTNEFWDFLIEEYKKRTTEEKISIFKLAKKMKKLGLLKKDLGVISET